MKRFLIAILGLAAMVAAGSAGAVCSVFGDIYRVQVLPAGGVTTVFVKTHGAFSMPAPIFFVYTTVDLKMGLALVAAEGKRVQIIGSAASCPAAGNPRPAGVVTTFIINP